MSAISASTHHYYEEQSVPIPSYVLSAGSKKNKKKQTKASEKSLDRVTYFRHNPYSYDFSKIILSHPPIQLRIPA